MSFGQFCTVSFAFKSPKIGNQELFLLPLDVAGTEDKYGFIVGNECILLIQISGASITSQADQTPYSKRCNLFMINSRSTPDIITAQADLHTLFGFRLLQIILIWSGKCSIALQFSFLRIHPSPSFSHRNSASWKVTLSDMRGRRSDLRKGTHSKIGAGAQHQ